MARIGCPHGCPLDYHEETCPASIRQVERDRQRQDEPRMKAAARELYDLGFEAGYLAAMRDAELAELRKTTIRVERTDRS
jgi:hypothetical protein